MKSLIYAGLIVLLIMATMLCGVKGTDEIYTLAHGNGFVDLSVSGVGSVLVEENGKTECYVLNGTEIRLIGYNNTNGTALEYALMFNASENVTMIPSWKRPEYK